MKIVLTVVLGLALAPLGSRLLAQSNSSSSVTSAQKTIRGMVKSEDNSLKVVADEDGKSWAIVNPQMLKNHRGQHVEIIARVADSGSLRISSVKELPPGRLLKIA